MKQKVSTFSKSLRKAIMAQMKEHELLFHPEEILIAHDEHTNRLVITFAVKEEPSQPAE